MCLSQTRLQDDESKVLPMGSLFDINDLESIFHLHRMKLGLHDP